MVFSHDKVKNSMKAKWLIKLRAELQKSEANLNPKKNSTKKVLLHHVIYDLPKMILLI